MLDKTKAFNWGPAIFLITYHAILLTMLPLYLYYNSVSTAIIISTIVLLYATGLSITAGYHRYYSHRCYRTNRIIEFILLFLGSMTSQGSAIRWSFDHRLHHANVDTDDDPYSISKGFWYAHCLWILERPRNIRSKVVSDLFSNKLVAFQHRHYKACMIGSNAIVTLFLGWLFNDYLGAFVMTLWVRIFLLHHFTWFINSLAHTWGEKPFSKELSAVDNYCIGEGYHNYHHTFANDYRNGIRWFHFDPTKWLIWSLSKVGLATNLKRVDPVTIEKRIVLQTKDILLERIKQVCVSKKDEFEKIVLETSDRIVAKLAQFNDLKTQYLQTKKENSCRTIILELQTELKALKKSLRQDWDEWMALSKNIQSLT